MVRLDDFMARTSQDWYKSSPMNTAFDVHLCAYVQILIIVAEWRKTMNMFDKGQLPEVSFSAWTVYSGLSTNLRIST